MKFFVIARAFLYIFCKMLVGWIGMGWLCGLVGWWAGKAGGSLCWLGKLVGLVGMCKLVLAMLAFVAR